MTNEELFKLYDNDLVLRLHNVKNLSDTGKILDKYKEHLSGYPPSPELAKPPILNLDYLAYVEGMLYWLYRHPFP